MEYVGEVYGINDLDKRSKKYQQEGIKHIYFMRLRGNIIDATKKGNISRFFNHSCNPNAASQKWTVNDEIRVGFFSLREIRPGEEVTIDYMFSESCRKFQKCYCGSANCRGYIGRKPNDDLIEDSSSSSSEINAEIENDNNNNYEDFQIKDQSIKNVKKKNKEVKVEKIEEIQLDDDYDLINFIGELSRNGLKTKSQTISLARVMVRAKTIDNRISLLKILIAGDYQCRRLFLDYNGLKLLHNWISELTPDLDNNLSLYIELLNALDSLPVATITIIRKSKILDEVEKLLTIKKENEHPAPMRTIGEKSKNLLEKWKQLKEDFKIPKRKQEIKKEETVKVEDEIWDDSHCNHKSEHSIQYENCQTFREFSKHSNDNFKKQVPQYHSFKSYPPTNHNTLKSSNYNYNNNYYDTNNEEMRMRMEHKKNCAIFGLPSTTNPLHIPSRVNRATGEIQNAFGNVINKPLNIHYEPLELSTNPNDYHLPPMNLPPNWRFAICTKGYIYYYNEITGISQWEQPSFCINEASSITKTEDSNEKLLKMAKAIVGNKRKSSSSSSHGNSINSLMTSKKIKKNSPNI